VDAAEHFIVARVGSDWSAAKPQGVDLRIDQALAFAIIIGMVALFVWNRLRHDLVALLGLLIVIACRVVPHEKAFVGFGD